MLASDANLTRHYSDKWDSHELYFTLLKQAHENR